MNNLPIVINPRQPESFQLTYGGPSTSQDGFQPPNGIQNGNFVGEFNTASTGGSSFAGTWRFTALASRIRTLGRVYQNVTLGVTRTLWPPALPAPISSDSLNVPTELLNIGGNDYPIYQTPRDRIEYVLRLWHDRTFSISTVFGSQVADMSAFPLNMEIYGFELWVNPNTDANVGAAEVFSLMLH